LGTGYEVVKESFDDSQINTMKYDTVLYKTVNSKLSLYTGYHYTKNNNQNSLFDYNSSTVGQELASGFTYRFDRKNSLSISQSYDLANKRLADMYYTRDHRVCCWNVSLTYHKDYDGNDSKVKATVSLARW
jgi:LPS-assembly protein